MLDLDELEAKAKAAGTTWVKDGAWAEICVQPAKVLALIRELRVLRERVKTCETMGEAQKFSLIRMAQEICRATGIDDLNSSPSQIVAAVFAQSEELREARAAVAAERKACADVVRAARDDAYFPGVRGSAIRQALSCAEQAIRARGEKGESHA